MCLNVTIIIFGCKNKNNTILITPLSEFLHKKSENTLLSIDIF